MNETTQPLSGLVRETTRRAGWKLTLQIEYASHDIVGPLVEKLNEAAAVRPLDDHWRDKACAILIAAFPACWVHRGGHHIALHGQGPMRPGCLESTPCLARLVEARERKEAA